MLHKSPTICFENFFSQFSRLFCYAVQHMKKMFKNRYYVFVNLCGKSSNWKWYYNNALKMRYLSRQFSRQKVIWFSIVQIFTIEISIIHWLFCLTSWILDTFTQKKTQFSVSWKAFSCLIIIIMTFHITLMNVGILFLLVKRKTFLLFDLPQALLWLRIHVSDTCTTNFHDGLLLSY